MGRPGLIVAEFKRRLNNGDNYVKAYEWFVAEKEKLDPFEKGLAEIWMDGMLFGGTVVGHDMVKNIRRVKKGMGSFEP